LKQPLSNTTKFSLSDFKQKSQSIKINIKDFQSARDASLLTPSSEELDSSKSQKKLKSVTSKDNKYNNTYKLSPYIVTDVDLNNIDFELNNKIKSNSTADVFKKNSSNNSKNSSDKEKNSKIKVENKSLSSNNKFFFFKF